MSEVTSHHFCCVPVHLKEETRFIPCSRGRTAQGMNCRTGIVGRHFRGYFPYTVICIWYLFSQDVDFQLLPRTKITLHLLRAIFLCDAFSRLYFRLCYCIKAIMIYPNYLYQQALKCVVSGFQMHSSVLGQGKIIYRK